MNTQAQDLFARAYELAPEEREAFLSESCGDNVELRNQVEELLADAERADSFFGDDGGDQTLAADGSGRSSGKEAPVVEVGGDEQGKVSGPGSLPQGTGNQAVPSMEELGSDFPELEIVELLGRGGMGAVFKARQESLDRYVALKVLPANWNEEASFRERFEREAKTLASLNHPSIVTIHDFGERNGRFFFTMEYVDGTDLARMMKSGEMNPEQALSLIPPICEAIQFAHDAGVVHRDIKPGNILVGRDGRVKVADFGIAKLGSSQESESDVQDAVGGESELTGPFGVVGTPRYMAPEQATASTAVDHRADLYALGAVFYEMLVGMPPSKDEVLLPPSRQAGINRRWDRVVMRALEVDPDRRYQNATEIKTAVESVLAEQKKLLPVWLKAMTVLVVGGGLFYLLWRGLDSGGKPQVNSLGMELVSVQGVEGLVSAWETRVKDFELFVDETGRSWKTPSFTQTPDHPAVHVSWHEARAFCRWLTDRERALGNLKKGERYRLPTDLEWSVMASLTAEEGVVPQERHHGQLTIFPWGEEALIPEGVGNYPDETGRKIYGSAAVEGYEDSFAATAPVGSFPPTKDGLYDLGGNVWEWTDSAFSPDDGRPVMRGGGWWAADADDGWKSLLASHRRADVEATESQEWDVGFRVVRGPEPVEEEADLFSLILIGDREDVAKAIEEGADVNASNRAGQPPIVLAADAGNLEMVKLLHEHGAGFESSDRRGRTPLHAAATIGHTELTRWLLEQGANPGAKTIAGEEAILLAVGRAPIALLDLLLEKGGPDSLTRQSGVHQNDAFTQACLSSPDETLHWIIEKLSPQQIEGLSLNRFLMWGGWLAGRDTVLMTDFLAKTSGRWTPKSLIMPLVYAVNYDREDNFDLLMNVIDGRELDDTAMGFIGNAAVGIGRPWAVKRLLARGWDPKAEDDDKGGNLLFHTMNTDRARDFIRGVAKEAGANERNWYRKNVDQQIARWPPPQIRETIRILVEAGLDLEARDQYERTPAIKAAMNGNLEALETFLKLGAEIEAKDNMGFTSLLSAIEKGHLELVKVLDQHGADFSAVTTEGRGVFHVVHRHVDVARYLLARDIPVDAKDKDGATPLAYLAVEGDEEVISLLLKAGADAQAIIREGEFAGATPLHRVCFDPGKKEGETARQERETNRTLGNIPISSFPPAGREERFRAITLLLDAGGDPMAKSREWMTPLHVAAKSGLPDAVELFLEKGADPNALTKILNCPLHIAASWGNLECVRVLLEHKAVTDSPVWQMPLAISAVNGNNPEMMALLLEHKMPIDRRAVSGHFPLHQAAHNGFTEIVEVLLEAGADPEVRDFQYRTPAHIAAVRNHLEVADLLWKDGARMNAVDMYSLTPAQLARNGGHIALAAHFEKLNQKPVTRPDRDKTKPSPRQ